MQPKRQPLISIVMPARNAGKFLRDCLDSVLSQTYPNWELIAVNDASTDNTLSILHEYATSDSRIRILSNRTQLGVSFTAEKAIQGTKGAYIARMDADDIMVPYRLESQLKFLQGNPSTVAVGGQCPLIDTTGEIIGKKSFPTSASGTYALLFTAVPIQQPAIMINRQLLPKNFAWYPHHYTTGEEVDMLFRMTQYGELRNLPVDILFYRQHPGADSLRDPKQSFYNNLKTRTRAVINYGYKPSFNAILTNIAQLIVVTLLPAKLLYPVYYIFRGVKPVKFSLPNISLSNPSPALSE